MLSQIVKFFKIKWIVTKPQKKKILIYDRESESYSRYLFTQKAYEILDSRYESINLYVFFSTLFNNGISNFKENYKKIFINLVSPKIVYTAIDNNPAFFKLKDIYDKPTYISDQNGMSKITDSYTQDAFYKDLKNYTKKMKKKTKSRSYFPVWAK